MKYTESQGNKPFDWNEFLNKETYTPDELEDAENKAGKWVTCGVGNQCDLIPRYKGYTPKEIWGTDDEGQKGKPKDEILLNLGIEFDDAIEGMSNYFEFNPEVSKAFKIKAKDILQKIEIRSQEILNELGKRD